MFTKSNTLLYQTTNLTRHNSGNGFLSAIGLNPDPVSATIVVGHAQLACCMTWLDPIADGVMVWQSVAN